MHDTNENIYNIYNATSVCKIITWEPIVRFECGLFSYIRYDRYLVRFYTLFD